MVTPQSSLSVARTKTRLPPVNTFFPGEGTVLRISYPQHWRLVLQKKRLFAWVWKHLDTRQLTFPDNFYRHLRQQIELLGPEQPKDSLSDKDAFSHSWVTVRQNFRGIQTHSAGSAEQTPKCTSLWDDGEWEELCPLLSCWLSWVSFPFP